MRITRTMFDLLDVATCDGHSLCQALTQYRVKAACGKTNHWYSNYTESCQKVLVREISKLCYLVGLMPTNSEYRKGVRTFDGEEIRAEGSRVVLRPRSHEDVNVEPTNDGDADETRADDEPMDREEPPPAQGGGESPAAPPSSVPTEGGDQIPAGHADAVSDMHKVLEVDYILQHRLDPLQGLARPFGLREGWHVYNGSRKLACGCSSPPHVAGADVSRASRRLSRWYIWVS